MRCQPQPGPPPPRRQLDVLVSEPRAWSGWNPFPLHSGAGAEYGQGGGQGGRGAPPGALAPHDGASTGSPCTYRPLWAPVCRVCYFTIEHKMTANEAREGPKRTREDVGFLLFPSGPPSRTVFSQNWPTSFTDCSQPCAGLDSELRVPETERHIPGQTQPVLWVTSMSPYSSRPRRDRLCFIEPGRRGQGSYHAAQTLPMLPHTLSLRGGQGSRFLGGGGPSTEVPLARM